MNRVAIDATFFNRSNAGYADIPIPVASVGTLPVGAAGTAANGEPNVAVRMAVTLAASADQAIDLFTLTNALGASVVLAEVHCVVVQCITAGGTGNIQKGATDPWTGLGTTPVVPFDASFPFFVGSAAGIAVSNTDKTIKVTNTGSASATFVAYVLGRA